MGKTQPAVTFYIDDTTKVESFREGFDPRTRARDNALAKESDAIKGARLVRNEKSHALALDIQEAALAHGRAVHQFEKDGKQITKETRTVMPSGGELIERTSVPIIANLETRLARLKAQRNALEAEKLPPDDYGRVNEVLADLAAGTQFIPAELPTVATPEPGKNLADQLAVEIATADMLEDGVERDWAAGRTQAEMKERMHALIDAEAQAPNLGGLRRGSSIDRRGEPRVQTPLARIGWPRQNHQFWMTANGGGKLLETRDALPTLLWLFGDEIKARLDAVIDERYSDDGTIPEKLKPALIAKAESDLWNQRRVVEETYLAAVAAGFAVTRPRDTPVEILLGLEKFGSKPRVEPEPEPVIEPEPEPLEAPTPSKVTKKAKPAAADIENEFG